jgi:hypothetical protein
MVAQHFKGEFAWGKIKPRNRNLPEIKAFAAISTDEIAVMVMNMKDRGGEKEVVIRLDDVAIPEVAEVKINFDFETDSSCNFTIRAQLSLILILSWRLINSIKINFPYFLSLMIRLITAYSKLL